MKKEVLLFFFSLLFFNISFSQNSWNWAKKAGGSYGNPFFEQAYDNATSLVVTHSGDIAVTGYFKGHAVFDTVHINSDSASCAFVAKYKMDGNLLWAKSIPQSPNSSGVSIAVNSLGEIVVAGNFEDSISFDGTMLYGIHQNYPGIFVATYSDSGTVLSARLAGHCKLVKMALDDADNIYLCGSAWGDCMFDTMHVSFAPGQNSYFVAKYNPSGTISWLKKVTDDIQNLSIQDMKADGSGNMFITGEYTYHMIVDGLWVSGTTVAEAFICKFNTNGILQWVKKGTGGSTRGDVLAISEDGSIYSGGRFSGNVYMDSLSVQSDGVDDLYITKFNQAGTVQFMRAIYCSYWSSIDAMTCDTKGNTLITGTFIDTIHFDGITKCEEFIHYNSSYLAAFNSFGYFEWADIAGGINSSGITTPQAICADKCGTPYTCGYFVQNAKFGSTQLTSLAASDLYLAKHSGQLYVSTSSDVNADICRGDSITLHAYGASNYLWMPGSIHGSPITVAPSHTTTYTVTADDSDTCSYSGLLTVTVHSCLGIHEKEEDFIFETYPNPTTDLLSIESNEAIKAIELSNLLGEKVYRNNQSCSANSVINLDLSFLKAGVYVLSVESTKRIYRQKMVKID